MKHRARHFFACYAHRKVMVAASLVIVLSDYVTPRAIAQGSALPEEDIRGPRTPVIIPSPTGLARVQQLLTSKKVLIATPVAAATGVLIWFLMLRRGNHMMPFNSLEQAREALRRIDADRTTLPADDLAERTAGVVRHFISANFGIAAPQRTTEEFFTWLAHTKDSPLQVHTDVLQAFLKSCDMAKFAGAEFDGVERFALLETANRFVQTAAYIAPSGAASAPFPSPVPPSVPPAVPSPTP